MTREMGRTWVELSEREDVISLRHAVAQTDPAITIIRAIGIIDIQSSGEFQSRIMELIERGTRRIVLDMSHVGHVSSVGIAACVLFLKRLKELNGRMIMCGVRPGLAEVLQLLGLGAFFEQTETEREALALIERRAPASVFPRISRCPICSARVQLRKAGRFRCRTCAAILRVDHRGRAVTSTLPG